MNCIALPGKRSAASKATTTKHHYDPHLRRISLKWPIYYNHLQAQVLIWRPSINWSDGINGLYLLGLGQVTKIRSVHLCSDQLADRIHSPRFYRLWWSDRGWEILHRSIGDYGYIEWWCLTYNRISMHELRARSTSQTLAPYVDHVVSEIGI